MIHASTQVSTVREALESNPALSRNGGKFDIDPEVLTEHIALIDEAWSQTPDKVNTASFVFGPVLGYDGGFKLHYLGIRQNDLVSFLLEIPLIGSPS